MTDASDAGRSRPRRPPSGTTDHQLSRSRRSSSAALMSCSTPWSSSLSSVSSTPASSAGAGSRSRERSRPRSDAADASSSAGTPSAVATASVRSTSSNPTDSSARRSCPRALTTHADAARFGSRRIASASRRSFRERVSAARALRPPRAHSGCGPRAHRRWPAGRSSHPSFPTRSRGHCSDRGAARVTSLTDVDRHDRVRHPPRRRALEPRRVNRDGHEPPRVSRRALPRPRRARAQPA